MNQVDVVRSRLRNQRIDVHDGETPADIVRWLGAVQAQDYRGALWGVGLRVPGVVERDVEMALADRAIVRTWPMRGTLHFVAPDDVRWMLELLAPRVIARSAGRYRQLELDEATLARCRTVVERALGGGKQLSRPAIYEVLDAAGVPTGDQRGLHILGWLAMNGAICFGAPNGSPLGIIMGPPIGAGAPIGLPGAGAKPPPPTYPPPPPLLYPPPPPPLYPPPPP